MTNEPLTGTAVGSTKETMRARLLDDDDIDLLSAEADEDSEDDEEEDTP